MIVGGGKHMFGLGFRLFASVATAGLFVLSSIFVVFAQDRSIADGVYTSEQAARGKREYTQQCAACHGVNAEGGISFALTGGEPLTNGIDTAKTIGNFWPYATTIFDYTRRAMPWMAPRTLTDDQVYALTAYLLALNGIIEEDDVMNADTLPQVQMPNRDGFIVRFPERTPR